jgi:hypothetical protein
MSQANHDFITPGNRRLADALRSFLTVPPDSLRTAMERLVEELIDALDTMDGDPDLEPQEPEEDATSWGFA